jgi:DNA uptake protein ComE-like DNA-binding protein
MTEHPKRFSDTTLRNVYTLCALIAAVLIYKHLAADRLQTQRIEALEAHVNELTDYLSLMGGSAAAAPCPTAMPKTDTLGGTSAAAPIPTFATHSAPTTEASSAKFKTPIWIDLNRADSALLVRVPGIGEKTAAAIVRYRTRLGGYTRVEQVAEAAHWVQPDQMERWRNDWLRCDTTLLTHLSVNQSDFKTLLRHPYLEYAQVKALFSVRDRNGRITSWQDLIATGVFNTTDVERLTPYLTFD